MPSSSALTLIIKMMRSHRSGLHGPLARTPRVVRPVRSSRGLVSGLVRGGALMTDGLLRRLFWHVVDQLDYLVTLARLRILDMLTGPLPETSADRQRQRDRERIKRALPEIER